MRDLVLIVRPIVTLLVGVYAGKRIERDRRDRELDDLLGGNVFAITRR